MDRKLVNYRVAAVKRMFRWAVAQGLVPADVRYRLDAVENIKRGEFGVPVTPRPARARNRETGPSHIRYE